MRLSIAERLRPFSHQPGTRVLIPGTRASAQFFPSLIRVWDPAGELTELPVSVVGPVHDFLVSLDLERGLVTVSGHAQDGFFRYELRGNRLRNLKGEVVTECDFTFEYEELLPQSRLSLGMHKKQNWEALYTRMDCRELLPIWYHLAQQLPGRRDPLNDALDLEAFEGALKFAVRGLMFPVPIDDLYQGIPEPQLPLADPYGFLQVGAACIERLFLNMDGEMLHVLPHLPTRFDAGRLLNVAVSESVTVDIEWTKKRLRRLTLVAQESGILQLSLYKGLKSFRLNGAQRHAALEPLQLAAGEQYELDRFQS